MPVPAQLAERVAEECSGKQPDDLIFTSPLGKTLRLNIWR